ncbi:hypothetical protein N7492_007175 [Penicillium capsulatum]|uniref:FAD/NAD(P)-binding domain-containing protein n=1 Tax=Penicillium capsulatum TaxID=69766 RepID=A0A9W9HZC2_9EURO|nr:hypothetical protein N7492_007175 [Penicillium capsulatum]KAJ6117013.1 hypothetical protein N7512_006738 [Penicillium capsulatum]
MPSRSICAMRPGIFRARQRSSCLILSGLCSGTYRLNPVRSRTLPRRKYATEIEHTTAIADPSPGKERVVILGSGWAGYNLSRRLSSHSFLPIVISPRTYFVFTPLLTDAASGSLDFSSIIEPVRDPGVQLDFIQAAARSVDLKKKTVLCEATVVKSGVTETPRTHEDERRETRSKQSTQSHRLWEQGETFEVPYDKLVIAVGAVSRTFGTPGVRENAMFFKDIGDAKRVKRRLRECFELAVLPTTSAEMRRWLLHFAIVGAGPTGIELAASLRDFIHNDIMPLYPALDEIPKISLYDVAPKVLSMFDESLSRYAMDTMRSEGIDIKTSHHPRSLRWGEPGAPGPHEMDPKRCLTLTTEEEGEVGVGMCVWATGNAMPRFIRESLSKVDAFPIDSVNSHSPLLPPNANQSNWEYKKVPRTGALLVDGHLRVQLKNDAGETAVLQDVFALGDNAMPQTGAPPATAQASFQEAKWLAARLNKRDIDQTPPFSFRNLGTLAYIGNERALMQIPHSSKSGKHGHGRHGLLPEGITGRAARLVWNMAYITMSISWRNRFRVAIRWTINKLFGRDVARF